MVDRPFPPRVPPRRRQQPYRMEPSTRIALVIVGAVIGVIGYREWSRARDVREADEVLQGITTYAQQGMAQAQAESQRYLRQQAAQLRAQQQRQAYEDSRYVLADDQECVGGAVVQVQGNAYTQIGSISQPVHCVGRRADRPLR